MEDPNMNIDIDDNAPESEKPVSKPLYQTSMEAQFQEVEAGVDQEAKRPKTLRNSEESGNSEEKCEFPSSPSSDRPECSLVKELEDEYRALRRDNLVLQEERASLTEEVIKLQRDIRNIEMEKQALLDKLVVVSNLPLENK